MIAKIQKSLIFTVILIMGFNLKASAHNYDYNVNPIVKEPTFSEKLAFPILDKILRLLNYYGYAQPLFKKGLDLMNKEGQTELFKEAISEHASLILKGEYENEENRLSFLERSAKYIEAIRLDSEIDVALSEKTAFHNATFVKELEKVSKAKFKEGNKVKFLTSGPDSFKAREELIKSAQKSIYFLVWSFYDDETGRKTAELLVERAKAGVDVRLVVDLNIGKRNPHIQTYKYMEDNGVKLIRWSHPKKDYYAQHMKVIVVDGYKSISGGNNPGNPYSHGVTTTIEGQYDSYKWRDTDVYIEGPASGEAYKYFIKLWNVQVRTRNLKWERVRKDNETLRQIKIKRGDVRTSFVWQEAGGLDHHVYFSILKAMDGATKSIDIENAYFLTLPGMHQVIMSALMRGVKVRVLTNSHISVDETLVSEPIMKSLPDLKEAGAEVYVKKGDTLHSKYVIVDDAFVSIGSLNLHPRSLYYDNEHAFNMVSETVAKRLKAHFEKGLEENAAKPFEMGDEKDVTSSFHNRFIRNYLYDHL